MPREIHEYTDPDRFIVGTVGQPGERVFYLQARQGFRTSAVALEKEQCSILAERMDGFLEEVGERLSIAMPAIPALVDDLGPLDTPVDELFRVGGLALGWDESKARVIVEAYGESDDVDIPDLGHDDETGPDTLRVLMTPHAARQFAARAKSVVAAGRPPCPLCNGPLEPRGHICPRSNGYKRRS